MGPRAAPTAPATAFLPLATMLLSREGPLLDVMISGEDGMNSTPSSAVLTSLGFWT